MTTKRIAYLGPAGTFTEEATLRYDGAATRLPHPTIDAVFAAVESRAADEGLVPIENSIEGSINVTLDLLIHQSPLHIAHEVVLPIEQCLLAPRGTSVDAAQVVYSHPQALAQCRKYLERRFPTMRQEGTLSTAAAVEEAKKSKVPAVAIAPRRAAELYDVDVVERGIQDQANNMTRFVVLSDKDSPRTGADRTSICVAFNDDRPGLLYAAMGEFARRNINLSKVESRPNKQQLGRYFFLIDLEGHRTDANVAAALDGLRRLTPSVKVFGSYPRWKATTKA